MRSEEKAGGVAEQRAVFGFKIITESQDNSSWKGPQEVSSPASCSKQSQL